MGTVTKLNQPFRKRLLAALSKLQPKDGAGLLAGIMVMVGMIEEMRGHTDKATYTVALAIFLLLICDRPQVK